MKALISILVLGCFSGCVPIPVYSKVSVPPLQGRVLDSVSGRAVKGALVSTRFTRLFTENGPTVSSTTDADGVFSLEASEYRNYMFFLPIAPIEGMPDHFRVMVSHPKFESATDECIPLPLCTQNGPGLQCVPRECIVRLAPLRPVR